MRNSQLPSDGEKGDPGQPQPGVRHGILGKLKPALSALGGILLVAAAVSLALVVLLAHDKTKAPPQHLTQADINVAVSRALASATPAPSYQSKVYALIYPSIVEIQAKQPKGSGGGNAIGTGVVVEASGTILTSLHVVAGATEIDVLFADGTQTTATVVGTQPDHDLAVLNPDLIPDDLQPATLGNSGALHVGDQVAAVGNPFGIYSSLSSGVVSGLGRTFTLPKSNQTITDMIQFDAAVNPGNSGGPLVDSNGDVVGIVTGLLNPTDGDFFVGIGFAVPIETAATAMGPPWY